MTCAPLVWMTTMADHIEILCVRAADGGARLVITVKSMTCGEEKKESLSVFASHLTHLPTPGVIGEEMLELLRREHALCAALDTGLRSLGSGGGSSLQLKQKLRARGVAADVAMDAARELEERGYLQERKNALSLAARNLRKLWGDRRILADLRAKGYAEEAISAVREMLEGEDAMQRCAKLLEKRMIAALDEAQLQKLIASLMRYGYTRTEIRAALQKTMRE